MILGGKQFRANRQIESLDVFCGIEGDLAELAKSLLDGLDRSVIDDAPIVDDDDALAQLFDVAQVVRGQHDGHALGDAFPFDEVADALLDDQVQADGRLVQIDDLWLVDQRRRQLGAHLLPQRHVADGDIEQLVELQRFRELIQHQAVLDRVDVIDSCDQVQRFDQGQVPPQLRALAEDHADVAGVIHALAHAGRAPAP